MLIDMQKALRLCGITGATLAPLICYDPDEKPNYHTCDNALVWKSGKRRGLVTEKGRVSEFINDRQKILPFGGRVSYTFMDGKKERTGWKDSALEDDYSALRFSQYGIA